MKKIDFADEIARERRRDLALHTLFFLLLLSIPTILVVEGIQYERNLAKVRAEIPHRYGLDGR